MAKVDQYMAVYRAYVRSQKIKGDETSGKKNQIFRGSC